MMVDQKEQAPEYVVTSLVWNMRPTIEAVVEAVDEGSYEAVDLAEYSFMMNGGSSIAPINTGTAFEIPAELIEQVEAQKAEIEAGDSRPRSTRRNPPARPRSGSDPEGTFAAGPAEAAPRPLVELRGITKRFGTLSPTTRSTCPSTRRGARPARGERRRQVHADPHPLRAQPARRGRDPHGRDGR